MKKQQPQKLLGASFREGRRGEGTSLVQLGSRGGRADTCQCRTVPKGLPQSLPGARYVVPPGKQAASSRNAGLPNSRGAGSCWPEPTGGGIFVERGSRNRRGTSKDSRYHPSHFTLPPIFKEGGCYYLRTLRGSLHRGPARGRTVSSGQGSARPSECLHRPHS